MPGQAITIWATGLGPVSFPDNVAPTHGDVAAALFITIGGKPAVKLYSGRAPGCSGVDQVVVNHPKWRTDGLLGTDSDEGGRRSV